MTTYEEYRALPGVNISTLLKMAKSPAHYRHAVEHGSGRETAAMGFGRLAHVAILEPERYESELAIWRGGRRAGKAWEAWLEENAGKVQVKDDEHEQLMAMSAAVREHPAAGPYLASTAAMAEVTVAWQHRLGIDCKSRLDWVDLDSDVIVDLKTTIDASEVDFGRAAARYRYHTRAAFYCDAYRARWGKEPTFVLIAVEKEPPYAVGVYRIPEDAIDAGRNEYEDLLARVKLCRESGHWPGPAGDRESDLVLPAWVFAGDDDLELIVDGEATRV